MSDTVNARARLEQRLREHSAQKWKLMITAPDDRPIRGWFPGGHIQIVRWNEDDFGWENQAGFPVSPTYWSEMSETPDWNAIGARLTDADRRFCGAMEEAFRLMAVGVDRSTPDNPTAVRPESAMADALGELADICAQLAAPIVVTKEQG